MFGLRLLVFSLLLVGPAVFAYDRGYTEISDRLSAIYNKLEIIENKLDKLSGGNKGNTQKIQPVQGNSKSLLVSEADLSDPATEEENSYKHLLHLIKIKKVDEAREQLRSFVKTFPNSEFTASAYNLIGDASFNQGEYKQASVDFLKSYKLNKAAKSTPAMLMKLVTSLRNIEQYEHACSIIARVEKDYQNVDSIKSSLRIERKALSDFCH